MGSQQSPRSHEYSSVRFARSQGSESNAPEQIAVCKYRVKFKFLGLLVGKISRRGELLGCYISEISNSGRRFEQEFMFLDT